MGGGVAHCIISARIVHHSGFGFGPCTLITDAFLGPGHKLLFALLPDTQTVPVIERVNRRWPSYDTA